MTKKMEVKKKYFEYMVWKIIEWQNNTDNPFNFVDNNFSKLKVHKLLFFVCAASSSADNPGLLSIFDNFQAWPYGPVEADVFELINDLDWFVITRDGLTLKKSFEETKKHFDEMKNVIQPDKNDGDWLPYKYICDLPIE